MCWNAEVSLNTFLFSSFVLTLIMYNNAFTKYKIQELNNVWIYAFFASFIIMQLVEFFIWRNINDKYYNHIFSLFALGVLFIQPICSLMILSNVLLRNMLLTIYLLLTMPYCVYIIITHYTYNAKCAFDNYSAKCAIDLYRHNGLYSVKSKAGHLEWKFMDSIPMYLWINWYFFLFFSLVYEKLWLGILFAILTIGIIQYKYHTDNTFGSMWCWVINTIMIYYAGILLFYLPFCEKKRVC
jgi:hypothetical protein